jgi:hypothetical protein
MIFSQKNFYLKTSQCQIGDDLKVSNRLILRYSLGICLEGPRKTTKNLSQDNRSPGSDLNQRPPEYKAAVLTTRPQFSVHRGSSEFV